MRNTGGICSDTGQTISVLLSRSRRQLTRSPERRLTRAGGNVPGSNPRNVPSVSEFSSGAGTSGGRSALLEKCHETVDGTAGTGVETECNNITVPITVNGIDSNRSMILICVRKGFIIRSITWRRSPEQFSTALQSRLWCGSNLHAMRRSVPS